jgi:DNA-binding MurR/RpiR family transcriptional regulator
VVHARSPDALISEVFRAQSANLQFAEARNHPVLIAAAKVIERGAHVHVAGFRACYPLAFAFQYLYRLFRSEVTLLAGAGGTLEMNLRAIGARDRVVVISFAPYSREARLVARQGRKAGAKIVAITDSPAAPIALDADTVVLFPVDSPSFFPSAVAGLAVVESLVAVLLSRAGDGAVQRIEAAEQQMFDLEAYEKTPERRQRSRR